MAPILRLSCISFLAIFAFCSLKLSRAGIRRGQPHGFDSQLDGSNEGDTEDHDILNRRAVRKYPEDSEDMDIGHRQASIRVSPGECSCPTALPRATLVAIVAALAFLGIFSTSILLVVAVCLLRVVEKQKKKEKAEKPGHSCHQKRAPPAPSPRPEHSHSNAKSLHGYERLHPVSSRATQGVYLNASELNPGPRVSRERSYQNATRTPAEPKSTPENEYVAPDQPPAFSRASSENKYMNVAQSRAESLTGSVRDTVTSPLLSPKGRETHIYEEVE